MKVKCLYFACILTFVKYETDAEKLVLRQSNMTFQAENNTTERVQFICGFKMPTTNNRAAHVNVR